MKNLKWDPILVGPDEKQKALEGENEFFRELAQDRWISSKLQEVYYSLCEIEDADVDEWLNDATFDVIAMASLMATFDRHPSLVQMQVPFGVRRQMYEAHDQLFTLIETALSDHYFMLHFPKFGTPHHQVAHAIWKWYYSVFEPISNRFRSFGSEYFHNKSNN